MSDDGADFVTVVQEIYESQSAFPRRKSGKWIRRRIERRFDAIISEIASGDPEQIRQTSHARWLLDNSHLVRQALQQIEIDLPASYHRQLAKITSEQRPGIPRIFVLVDQAITQSNLPLDYESLAKFCRDYESATEVPGRLTLGELWAVPIALRIALLARLCEAAELNQAALIPAKTRQLAESTPDNADVTVVAGCVTSLRSVATFNWPDFVEQTSAVEQCLRRDPSTFYPRMDFRTRDHYRGAIEQIAERSPFEQLAVADAALQLAKDATDEGIGPERQHIGYYLVDKGRRHLEAAVDYRPSLTAQIRHRLRDIGPELYLFTIVGLAACASIALLLGLIADNASPLVSTIAAIISLVPLLSVTAGAVNFLMSALVSPYQMPKLDFSEGISAGLESIVVVPMLLSSAEEIAENLKTLEQNYLGNADPRLRFALLSDFTDAATATTESDQPLLDLAVNGITRLNLRYATNGVQPFLLFHRCRLWNNSAQHWMGWERKRGKLEEFNGLLRGAGDTSYVLQHGEGLDNFGPIRYVITLDADTYMPTGTAARLVGAMAHPLNIPRFDDASKQITAGYSILQPRLETNPVTGADTPFARIFAGDTMLDLYTNAVSDAYQDLFGDAVFAGKGIYDVDAFRRSVADHVPSDAVLSHDLLEGLHGRAGLVSDIVLLENYPSNYLVYIKRLHRWIRGDWQLLPWLVPGHSLSSASFKPGLIGRWKLFDNLRRSLVAPSILALLIIGWIYLPGNVAAWTLLFALLPGLPILIRVTLALRTSLWRWGTIESSLRNLLGHTGADIGRWILALVFLPAEAYVVTDAALRTIYRVTISRRRLLEWSTAAVVARSLGKSNQTMRFLRNLWFGPATAIATGVLIFLCQPGALGAACVLLVLWFISPLIALRLGRHIETQPPPPLADQDKRLIRIIARDTWRFFERFVGPDSNWLPPDNVQEYPTQTIAERTSPTNIGMMLLSTVTAYDLGYLGQRQLLARLSNHLETIDRLHKHRGHLLNWYGTRDLQPLEPRYVSTVDSGNFVAALINVRQTLEELPHHARTVERTMLGLADELAALHDELFGDDSKHGDVNSERLQSSLNTAFEMLSNTDNIPAVLRALEDRYCSEIEQAFLTALEQNPNQWSAEEIGIFREDCRVFRQRIRKVLDDIELFAPWLPRLATPPALFLLQDYQDELRRIHAGFGNIKYAKDFTAQADVTAELIMGLSEAIASSSKHELIEEAQAWLESLRHDIESTRTAMQALDQSRENIIHKTTVLIRATDFRFLYDTNRNLFRVGFNASTGEDDTSYYDLLASEARIASFVAIAKGDIPAKHWMHLGRPLTRIRGLRILLSWSATAFEYLMPRLIMHSPTAGLINQSCEGAVHEQIRFGHEYGIPWGISESGYAQFDSQNHYQYYAFGIPKLGLKWDQGERLVVSSYASVLALPYAPRETLRNLRKLMEFGAAGHYGLYEALDFGEAHKPRPTRPQVVQSYMAHHQGMILVAIGNVLHDDETLHRFHRDPHIASVEYLLYERLPQRMETRPLEQLPSLLKELPSAPATITEWQTKIGVPELAVLSNSRLSCRISDQGGGALYWQGMAVTRWDPLASGPSGGACIYVKDLDNDRLRCFGVEQLPDDVERIFAPHSAEFRARRGDLLMRMTVTVAPSVDVEVRRITLTNDGAKTRRMLLSSYSEPVLGLENADRRHPAFSKLFIESQYLEDENTLLFRRQPRESERTGMYLAHTAVAQPGAAIGCTFEVDRGAFFGRGNDRTNPAALVDPEYTFSDTVNANLDSCAAMALTLEIPPRTTIQCAFLTAVGDSRATVVEALRPFRSLERIDWTIATARLYSESELTGMRTDSENVRTSFQLLAKILWPRTLPHIGNDALNNLRRVQDALWRHGISGDRPIITLRVDGEEDLKSAEALLKCLNYLSHKGFAADAIFLDENIGGYATPINDRLRKLVETHLAPGREKDASLAFIVPMRNLSANEKSGLVAAARLFIDPRDYTYGRTFSAQLGARDRTPARMPAFVPQPSSPLSSEAIAPMTAREDLLFKNRLGGMLPDYDGYSMIISEESQTPAPWCNVLANPHFGSLVSEAGSMCTWWGNSSENRLTPWHNDPVLDKTGEALYVRDEETGESWSLTPQTSADNTPYRVTHAIGESLFEHNRQGLEQRLQVFVDPEEPIKILRIRFTNKWRRARRLTVTFAVEWILGNNYTYNRHLLLPDRDDKTGALLVRNGFDRLGGNELAFVACELPAHGISCSGREFFGKRRSWAQPPGLAAVGLSDQIEASAQPCAIYQVHIDMRPNADCEFHFVLGAAKDQQAANALISQSCRAEWVDTRYEMLRRQWDSLLGAWSVKTPDPYADAVINRWLLYQVISSRLWGRIGFYQASGGYGYRDQLQDVLALLDTDPQTARAQIVLAASRQFLEGDVLHWWHEAPLRGVRTRCSDDLLWLAYSVSEYIEVTDDWSILKDNAPFLAGEVLGEHQLEHYAEYQTGTFDGSIYEHCYRAIDARIAFGSHGIPFIGTGDWNDGLNRVGEKGQGESVWMAWFLIVVCRRFAPLCRQMDDDDRADYYEKIASDLLTHTRETAWAGDWYLRGYFDDGTPLGAPGAEESEIDLNAQTWSVLVDPTDPAARRAMQSAEEKLFDSDHRLIKLLAPPFQKMTPDPGYIRAYPPGVRENGGQYTHAAVWAAWAMAAMGDKAKALRLFDWLNPLKRARNDEEISHYRLEPYVMPGDVYGVDAFTGRGGWSWYSGSAAWLYRFAVRQLLGLQRRGNQLFVRPCLPEAWPAFEATLRYGEAEYRLRIHNPSDFQIDQLFVVKNGTVFDTQSITLGESGVHTYDIFASDGDRHDWLTALSPMGAQRGNGGAEDKSLTSYVD